ncbi:MAG: M57 family metalloprotease [Myxococcota bacterium]
MTSGRRLLLPLVASLLVTTACGGNDSGDAVTIEAGGDRASLTFEEFLGMTYEEPGTGVYIADGDTPYTDIKQLEELYEKIVQSGALIVHQSGGVDVKWTDTQKVNLTYCVSTSFGSNYSTVVQAMLDATGAWEAIANVNFNYVSAQDASCTAANNNVLFDVNPVDAAGQYLARAFFPDQTRSTRNVLIDASSFSTTPPLTVTGILRHELGHVLGFRHEHTRPEAGTCFEDNNWRVLTTYDSASVMHYPQCNGTGDWSLVLTSRDVSGAALLYGTPGQPPPPPPPGGTVVSETVTGSVAQGASKTYGPYSVVAGTTFASVMTGTGDPDLYVRFGAPPTTTSYNCRPYLSGASESCNLTVPSGQTVAYVMVRGYTAATFSVKSTYTKPSSTGGGTPATQTYSGSIAASAQVQLGAFSVVPATSFAAVMTGTGDPDLYVRFGAAPTTTSYDCRPYTSGAAESCNLTVPSSQSSAYVMIRGYAAGTYNLTVSYTTP